MLRWLKRILATLLIGASCFLLFGVLRRDPVLFHIPGSCACTDVSPEVEGFSILNPFRSRTPERAANAFLADMNADRCPSNATAEMKSRVCDPAKRIYHRSVPRLAYRKDEPRKVSLFYGFRDPSMSSMFGSTGESEGMIVMVESGGAWNANEMVVTW
jgi:hypothetical protein